MLKKTKAFFKCFGSVISPLILSFHIGQPDTFRNKNYWRQETHHHKREKLGDLCCQLSFPSDNISLSFQSWEVNLIQMFRKTITLNLLTYTNCFPLLTAGMETVILGLYETQGFK